MNVRTIYFENQKVAVSSKMHRFKEIIKMHLYKIKREKITDDLINKYTTTDDIDR